MSWEDPMFTFGVFVTFVFTTLWLNAEYFMSVPLFIVVLLMTRSYYYRKNGGFKNNIIERGQEIVPVPFRAFSYLRVAVCGFKNFSRKGHQNPYPHPHYVKISYIKPQTSSSTNPRGGSSGQADSVEHVIAVVNVSSAAGVLDHASSSSRSASGSGSSGTLRQILANLSIIRSDNVKDGVIQNIADPWPRQKPDSSIDVSFIYPILQGDFVKNKNIDLQRANSSESTINRENADADKEASTIRPKFQAWEESEGLIRFSLFGDSPANSFIDSNLGSITIPLKDLVNQSDSNGSKTKSKGLTQSGLQSELLIWCPVKWNAAFGNHTAFVSDLIFLNYN